MDFAADRYYRNSGAVPFAGTVFMLLFGTIAAAALAFGYALLTYHNPIVYLTLLGTAAFGAGIGGAIRVGATLGKVRNKLFVAIVGLVIALFALYLTWAWYAWTVMREGFPGFPVIYDPVALVDLVQVIAENGVWSMGSWEPTGWQLYAIWGVEALIVVGISTVVAASNDAPFCEACNRWTGKSAGAPLLTYREPQVVRGDLESERYELLDELRREPVDPSNALHTTLYRCPNCRDSNYLSVAHTVVTTNKKGEAQTHTTEVLKNLRLPEEVALRLEAPFEEIEPREMPDAAGVKEESSEATA